MQTYYDNNRKIKIKENDPVDFDLISVANMYEYVVSTKERPIIGTYGLATCVGILINDDSDTYVLGHIISSYEDMLKNIISNMNQSKPIKIILIPGHDTVMSKLEEIITFLKTKENFPNTEFNIKIQNLQEYLDLKTESIEFAFDTRTKEFIKPDYNELFLEGIKKGRE